MTILRSHHILTYQYQCTAGGGRPVTRTCPASYEGSLQHSTSYILFKQYSTVHNKVQAIVQRNNRVCRVVVGFRRETTPLQVASSVRPL